MESKLVVLLCCIIVLYYCVVLLCCIIVSYFVFISLLDICSLIFLSDIVSINNLTLMLNIISQCDGKHIVTLPIKSILNVLIYTGRYHILLMSLLKTAVILHIIS